MLSLRPLIVIPTRNRSRLAIRAIESVLPQLPTGGKVIVSDNSTLFEHTDRLKKYLETLMDNRVEYLNSYSDLDMTSHWQWIIDQVMRRSDITHITFLTDRMIFKRDTLPKLFNIVAEDPHSVLSYNHETVDDFSSPVRLYCQLWTGSVITVTSERFLLLSSMLLVHPALPRMINCIVPIGLIHSLQNQFGQVFASQSPDFCFAYRLLSLVESIRYWDMAPLIHTDSYRSNGASTSRGILSPDSKDFRSKLSSQVLNGASPVPSFDTLSNAIAHEYCSVRNETGSSLFKPIDINSYYNQIEYEIDHLMNPELAQQQRMILYSRRPKRKMIKFRRLARFFLGPGRNPRRYLTDGFGLIVASAPTRPLWFRLNAHPPLTRRFKFSTTGDAVEFAERCGLRRTRHRGGLALLVVRRVDSLNRFR